MRLVPVPDRIEDEDAELLYRIIRRASRLLRLQGDDVDARILTEHGARILVDAAKVDAI